MRRPRCQFLLRCVVVGLLAALLLPTGADAQRRAQFGTRVDVLQVQVRVTDDAGAFVPGLGVEDFTLRVDGQERGVTTVYEMNLDATAGTDLGNIPPAAWRQWVLFFDAAFNTPRGVRAAQEAATEFVQEKVGSGDLVAVATFSTVTGARMIVPPTRDRRQVLEAIAGLGLNSATRNVDRAGFLARTMAEGVDPAETLDGGVAGGAGIGVGEALDEAIAQVRNLEFEQYVGVVSQYTEQLGNIGDVLRQIDGRKHVVYFSQGFDDQVLSGQALDDLAATTEAMQENAGLAIASSSGEDRFGSSEIRSTLEETLERFRASDAVIHVVDPTGLGGNRRQGDIRSMESRGGDFNARGSSRGALTALADATGGEMYWETNDVAGALSAIEEDNRAYYVLAFPRQPDDGEILEVDLDVARPGLTVEVPERVATPVPYEEMSEMARQMQVAEFITKGIADSDLVFDVATAGLYGDGEMARLPVVIEVPWEQLEELAEAGDDSRVELEIYTYALDEEGRLVDFANGGVNLDIDSMRDSPVAGLPFRYYDLLWATPGQRRVRAALRDVELGRLSAVTSSEVRVPHHASGEVAISGPIAVDWEHPGLLMRGFDADSPPPHKEDGPVAYPFMVGETEITPAAAAAGPAGSAHHVYFVAHNLGQGPNGPQASVFMGLQAPNGQQVQLAGQEMIARFFDEETDSIQMVAKATLPGMIPSGFYQLVVMVNDQVKGAQVSASMPIWVDG